MIYSVLRWCRFRMLWAVRGPHLKELADHPRPYRLRHLFHIAFPLVLGRPGLGLWQICRTCSGVNTNTDPMILGLNLSFRTRCATACRVIPAVLQMSFVVFIVREYTTGLTNDKGLWITRGQSGIFTFPVDKGDRIADTCASPAGNWGNRSVKMGTSLETETCGRCGGSGRHSYCQMHGDRCFRCGGRGRTLTKRGACLIAAAPELFDACNMAIQIIEQLIPEPSARGVADVVLTQLRAAIAKAGAPS